MLFTDAPGLVNDIDNLVKTADDVHRLIALSIRPHSSPISRHGSLKQVAAQVRNLAGSLHAVRLLATTFVDDRDRLISSDHNLNFLRGCRQTLHVLQSWLTETSSNPSNRHGSNGDVLGIQPQQHSHPILDPYAGNLSELPKELRQYCVHLGMALLTETFPAFLTSLSQNKVSSIQDRLPSSTLVLKDPERVRRDVFADLCPFDPFEFFTKCAQRHRHSSSSWLNSEPMLQNWMDPASNTVSRLWLNGQPGAGKTAMAVAVVEELRSRSATVIFHLVDWTNTASKQPRIVLGALIWQLVCQNRDAYAELKSFFDLPYVEDGAPAPTSDSRGPSSLDCRKDPNNLNVLSYAFRMAQRHFETVYIVIDGMDAVDDTVHLLEVVGSGIQEWDNTRALFISRDEEGIRTICSDNDFVEVEIRPRPEDIREYVDRALEQFSEAVRWPVSLDSETKNAISDALSSSTASFRLAECQLHYLYNLHSNTDRRKALRRLPSTLRQTYSCILSQTVPVPYRDVSGPAKSTSSRDRILLRTTLHWMANMGPVHSKNSLPELAIPEMCLALSVLISPAASFVSQLEDVDQGHISKLCGILIRKRDSYRWEYGHRTVYEFLQQLDPDDKLLGDFSLKGIGSTSSGLSIILLRFLNFQDFDQPSTEFETEKARIRQRHRSYPLYSYAATWWPLAHSLYPESHPGLTLRLFNTEPSSWTYFQWVQEFCLRHFGPLYGFDGLPGPLIKLSTMLAKKHVAPLHIAACLGLSDICRTLIENGEHDINSSHASGLGSPLFMAFMGPTVFRMLQRETASTKWKLLHSAPASLDYETTVDTLLDLGADCTMQHLSHGVTESLASVALLRCSAENNSRLFIKLIERGVTLDAELLATIKHLDLGVRPALSVLEGRHSSISHSRKACLNEIYECIMDKAAQELMHEPPLERRLLLEEVVESTWHAAEGHKLPCSHVDSKRPLLCSDEIYHKTAVNAIAGAHREILRRLLQDPRWDPNKRVEEGKDGGNSEAAGQTVLHYAVEDRDEALLELLLKTGSDHSIRDAKGRTPFLVAETPVIMEILLKHGADILAKDLEGRSIWHFAAANNDDVLLKALLKRSTPDEITAALKQVTKRGRTPLAEAIAYVSELVTYAYPATSDAFSRPDAALALLPPCKGDPAYFQSDVPLIHLAVEYGDEALVTALAEAGVNMKELAEDGSTPFHYLNCSATAGFIKLLGEKCGEDIPLMRNDGKTPFETVLLNFKTDGDDECGRTGHPSWKSKLDAEAFKELLDIPGAIGWRDHCGRTLWERVCDGVLLHYAHLPGFWTKVGSLIDIAITCLVEKGAHREYEKQHKKSAILPLVTGIWENSKLIPPWLMKPCITVLKQTHPNYFKAVKDEVVILLTLRWAAAGDRCALTDELLKLGTSIHKPARGLSAVDEMCMPGLCNLAMFNRLLKYAVPKELDRVNVFGRTPVQSLCFEQDTDGRRITDRDHKLKALIRCGANPNLRSRDDATPPTVLAITKNLADCARVLLENGADMKMKSDEGMDIALAAASKGCLRVLTWIQEKSPDWDWKATCSVSLVLNRDSSRDPWRKTQIHGCNAFHLAALNGQIAILHFYLEKGFLGISDPCFDICLLPIHFAALGGSCEAIRFLAAKGVDINARAADQSTPLHQAVRGRHPQAVRTLLSLGCDRAPAETDGITPLVEAIKLNRTIISGILFKETTGMEPSEQRPPNHRALAILGEAMETAIRHMDIAMCETILNHGCPVDIRMSSCRSCTPLLLTIRQGKPHMTRFLLDKGASKFTGQCKKHFSRAFNAVHEACMKEKSLSCLKDVLDAALRLDYNWVQSHMTPFHVAAEQKNIAALRILLDHVKNNIEAYSKWVWWEDDIDSSEPAAVEPSEGPSASKDPTPKPHPVVREIVNLCLQRADIDAPYFDGATALHIALSLPDSLDMIKLLLAHGADPNIQDAVLYTSLHMAAREQQARAIPLLVHHGADVHQRDGDGYTPLMRASRAGHRATMAALLAAGSDAGARCPEGLNALHCAAETAAGHAAAFRLLATPPHALDPLARDLMGGSALHGALLNPRLTGLALGGGFDLHGLAAGADLPKGLFPLLVENEEADMMLPRVLRRWPRGMLGQFLNVRPASYVSPLCNVAMRGYARDARLFLRFGADVELEGCEHGSALMAAATHGRLNVVRVLVGAGARVAYVDGEGRVRDAVGCAEKFPDVREWLLVGRYTEPNRLTEKGETSKGGEVREVVCWSGGGQVEYLFTGTTREHAQTFDESMFQYLVWLTEVRKNLRGKVVLPFVRKESIPLPWANP